MSTHRYALGIGLIASAPLVAATLGLGVAWDGAWFLLSGLDSGQPRFLHDRWIHAVLQAPGLAIAWFTDEPRIAVSAFGIGYGSVAAFSLAACWRIAGPDRRDLLVWPALGIGLVLVPGTAFLISEVLVVASLAWPCLLAIVLGRVDRHRLIIIACMVGIAIAHPLAAPVLGALALAALVMGPPSQRRNGRLIVPIAVGAVAAVVAIRYALAATPYEVEAVSTDRLASQLRGSVLGAPITAPMAAYAIGLAIAAGWSRRRVTIVAAVTLGVTAVALLTWAVDLASWERALGYRGWAVTLSLPLAVLAVVASRRVLPGHPSWIVTAIGVVSLVVLGAQGITWSRALDRLQADVAARLPGCVEVRAISWIRDGPLDHWGTTSLVLVLDGPAPTHIVAHGASCGVYASGPEGVPVKVLDGRVVDRLPAAGRWRVGAVDDQ